MTFIRLTPKQRRNIGKIVPFSLIWLGFGLVYSLVEKGMLGNLDYYPSTGNPYEFGNGIITTGIGSFAMGTMMGTLEVLVINRFFVRHSFATKIIMKTMFYLVAICCFLTLLTIIVNSIRMGVPPSNPEVLRTVLVFFGNFAFWSIVLYVGAILTLSLFVSEVSDNLGQMVLKNFLIGKYHKPKEEARVFLFLDMKSSTAIAERLGHIRYFDLLNAYYRDITEAVITTAGEIYQYVGDEIIVSWNLDRAVRENNCLRCFFLIKQIFREASDRYVRTYGFVPGFRAGLHYGEVTTGEIGLIKKEIIFTGDVLNTTARILGSCKSFGVDILISHDLLTRLDTGLHYSTREMGACELRGKETRVNLSTITELPDTSP